MADYDRSRAFIRNVGWVTADEQALLYGKRVAIAGLGGVGGSHLVTLARLGIGAFHIADLDVFEIENINRQYGARVSTLGREKAQVLAETARDINPQVDLKVFGAGVSADNVAEFLDGVDLYVDGLDFFAVAARRAVFAACARLGVPAITAAPLGMGAALLNFLPGGMTFDEYFGMAGVTENEQLLRFFVGLAPAGLQQRYLVDPSTIDLAAHRGPSTAMGCELCAGVAASQALKILLNRGEVLAAPHGLQYDAYLNRLRHTWRPGGARNLVQRFTLAVARERLALARPKPVEPAGEVEQILDLARWAPSGDNAQPWRFSAHSESLTVHGQPAGDIYDLRGHASQLAWGVLLETIDIAASKFAMTTRVIRRDEDAFDVKLQHAAIDPSPLLGAIRMRSVQRGRMPTTPLTPRQRDALAAAAAPFAIRWLDRTRAARLNFRNALLRLGLPEAFDTHAAAIEWRADRSETRLPDRALGVNPVTARIMRWALSSRERARWLDGAGGSLGPAVEMDLVPGLACAAHFALVASSPLLSVDDFVAAGRVVQRFWLTATSVGLQMQPQYTPLVFHSYVRDGVPFTSHEPSRQRARAVSAGLSGLLGDDVDRTAFYGRIGGGPAASARSSRLPLARLMIAANADGAS